ncbi:MAG: nitroreductase, partial [Lentisphaeria bacterium]|nr:nitroreductase [Lentisphaeria bacterium]
QSLGLGTCWCGFGVWAYRLIPSLRRKLKLPFFYKVDAMMLFGEPAIQYARPTAPEPMRIDPIRFKA